MTSGTRMSTGSSSQARQDSRQDRHDAELGVSEDKTGLPVDDHLAQRLEGSQLESGTKTAQGATRVSTVEAVDMDEDDVCLICQLLLYRPVITRCGHSLCEACMAQWAETSVTSRMAPVDVDEDIPGPGLGPSPLFGSTSRSKAISTRLLLETEVKCPMCRTGTTATVDRSREQMLTARYPSEYERRKIEESEVGRMTSTADRSAVQTLIVYIGNRHVTVPSRRIPADETDIYNNHEWTFFVRPSRTDIIEEVQILLHPTFRPPRVIRTRPPYSIRRLGWGIFTVTAYVILKAGYSWLSPEAQDSSDGAVNGTLGLEWTLDFESFEGKGAMERLKLSVKREGGGGRVKLKSKSKTKNGDGTANGDNEGGRRTQPSDSDRENQQQQQQQNENSRSHESTSSSSTIRPSMDLDDNQADDDEEDEEMHDVDGNESESESDKEEERENRTWERTVREYQRDGPWEPRSGSGSASVSP